MASQRQREANRRNGRKGGPKTETGKHRSRLNSLKHGLSSSTLVVLPEEDEREYNEVLRGFRASFNPCDDAENALVVRLAHGHWRSLRSRRVETGILHVTAKTVRGRARKMVENCPENLNPHEAIGVGFMTMPAEHWQTYLRYDTAISRDFFRTLEALTKLQRDRKKIVGQALSPAASQSIAAPDFSAPLAMAASATASGNGIRSVSHGTVRHVAAAILIFILAAALTLFQNRPSPAPHFDRGSLPSRASSTLRNLPAARATDRISIGVDCLNRRQIQAPYTALAT